MAVHIDDLNFAVEWLTEGFEGDDDSELEKASLNRVAEWIRTEIKNRKVEMLARQLHLNTGHPIAACRKAARKTLT